MNDLNEKYTLLKNDYDGLETQYANGNVQLNELKLELIESKEQLKSKEE